MTKHNDQERALFEAWFTKEIEPSVSYGNPDILRRSYWAAWQARAQLPTAGGAVPDLGFSAGVRAASDRVKLLVEDYDRRHGSTDPDTGTREYPGNGDEWVGQMMELIEDFTGIVAPHPVSGEQSRIAYVLARQTAVEIPNSKKELGYTVLDGIGVFATREEVYAVISNLSLPLGWVCMTTDQLLPGWMMPDSPAAAQDVSGLIQAVERALREAVADDMDDWYIGLSQALSAHRAQAQGGDK